MGANLCPTRQSLAVMLGKGRGWWTSVKMMMTKVWSAANLDGSSSVLVMRASYFRVDTYVASFMTI
jgi:hypothetical protein